MTASPASSLLVDLDRLERRWVALVVRLGALQGRARELQTQGTKLSGDIALAMARRDLAPQAAEAFTYLQEKAHAKAVGDFEDLLSAFVADVAPDAGKIHLELGTERGAPSLDIMLDNGGDLENIVDGNGGGVTNVVVTGLGFSALSRTSNRQLMLLDEPDCWLKASYVPNFTKVIAEVSNPRENDDGTMSDGCQTLMVSHNDIALMDEGAHIQDLRIEKDLAKFAALLGVKVVEVGDVTPCAYVVFVPPAGGRPAKIEVRYRPAGEGDDEQNALTKGFPYLASVGGSRPWTPEQPGVRWVEVTNLRRHVYSRMALSSGLNVLTGDINGGKSTMYFTALRAMAYGETDDTMIRHGADSAIVRMGLENDIVLEMVRSRKGSPKVMYRRYEAGVLVNEGRQENRGSAPSFILKALKIVPVDDLDIQLRSQKQPVFLLNETAQRRAKLLSVGRESGLLQALIEKQRLQLRRDRESIARNEIELNLVNRTLTVLAPLTHMAAVGDILKGLLEDARTSSEGLVATRALVAKLTPLVGKVALHGVCERGLAKHIDVPKVTDTVALAAVTRRLEKTSLLSQVADAPVMPATPVVSPTVGLADVIRRISRAVGMAALPNMPEAPVAPRVDAVAGLVGVIRVLERTSSAEKLLALVPTAPVAPKQREAAPLRALSTRISQLALAVDARAKEEKDVDAEAIVAKNALQSLKSSLGVCPVCEQSFGAHTHD